jgi:hypothetical protein
MFVCMYNFVCTRVSKCMTFDCAKYKFMQMKYSCGCSRTQNNRVKVKKVKSCPCHGVWGKHISPLILNFGARRLVSITRRLIYSRETPWYKLNRRLDPRAGLGNLQKRRSLDDVGIRTPDPRFSQRWLWIFQSAWHVTCQKAVHRSWLIGTNLATAAVLSYRARTVESTVPCLSSERRE